jgi:DNA-binding transcriptional regulator YiaG
MTQDYTCNIFRGLIAKCFDYALNTLKIQPEIFIKAFISSSAVRELDRGNPKFLYGLAGSELCEIILDEANIAYTSQEYIALDRTPEYWAGESVACYKYEREVSFAYIFSFISFDELLKMYPDYHETDSETFFVELDRINRKKPSSLQLLRQKAKLSQSEFAVITHTSIRTIQAYEQKYKDINKAEGVTLLRFADILNCKIEDLLER